MDIYNAIMKAAEEVLVGKQFDYLSCWTPQPKCGTPGCAVGWVAHARGLNGHVGDVCKEALGVTYGDFEIRMSTVRPQWWVSPRACSEGLRLYAAKYHTPAKPQRTDSELVADLVRKISTERIPEEA